jgi:hypothetical protein
MLLFIILSGYFRAVEERIINHLVLFSVQDPCKLIFSSLPLVKY